ncbi:hypothetical protein V8J88_11110 [Massilia sp. W12]|uniref:hypothetical protein n=1 Tax=Massilia sp. W12 TaxID=3126507 RepID=UPI0030D0CBA1
MDSLSMLLPEVKMRPEKRTPAHAIKFQNSGHTEHHKLHHFQESLLLLSLLLVMVTGIAVQKPLVFFVGAAAAIGVAFALGRRIRKADQPPARR